MPTGQWILIWTFEAPALIHYRIAALLLFAKFVKNSFYLADIFLINCKNTRFLFLLMCVLCTKGNEVVASYTLQIQVTRTLAAWKNGQLKMLPDHFHYSNIKMIFFKISMKKTTIFKTNFQISSRYALCCESLNSRNGLQLNSGLLNNYQNFFKKSFFVCSEHAQHFFMIRLMLLKCCLLHLIIIRLRHIL